MVRTAVLIALTVLSLAENASAQSAVPAPTGGVPGLPDLTQLLPAASNPQSVSASLQILVVLTVLTLIPSILIMVTAFPRIMIVLALLRQAIGVPQLPPGQVLLTLSLFVTLVVMTPTWQRIHADAVGPYLANQLGQARAMDITSAHVKDFMFRQIEQAGNEDDIYLFLEYAQKRTIEPDEKIDVETVPLTVIIPAFMLSELKTAYVMGFRIYLPFLVIDMVIATILLSMGMLMLPPVLISLPFKLLLFVLADGWHLVVETILGSFA